MIQIIEEKRKPRFGEQLVEGLSRGVSGLASIGSVLGKEKAKKEKSTADRLKGFSGTFDKYLKSFKEEVPGQVPKAAKEAMMMRARKLVEEGEDPEDAIRLAWDEEMAKPPKETEQSFSDKLSAKVKGNFQEAFTPMTFKEAGENLYGASAKMGAGAAGLLQLPLDALYSMGRAGRRGIGKLAGLSPEENEAREKKFEADIRAGEEATGVINPIAGTPLPEGLANATGGRSIAKTGGQRIVQGAVAGPSGVLAAGAQEVASGLGLPEWAQQGIGFATFLASGHGQIPSKIGSFAKRSLEKATKIGEKVNAPPEEILKHAQEMSGADMEKVNAGDGREIQKLNRGLNEIEQKTNQAFKQSEKFAKTEAENIRKDTARKLAESPLEEYYKPTTKEPVTAEGKLAKEMRQEPVKQEIARLENIMKKPDFHILSPMEREGILHELREAQFELKWGRKPASQAQIEGQIEKQHAEMREYITDATAKKMEKIKKQLELDKDAVQKAEKLAARGEIPGARVVDEFIKIHEQYLKGYEKLANELGEFVRKNQAVKGREPQLKRANELIDLTKQMAEVGHAKVAMQADKRKALGALEKPSGAFYKAQLRDLFSEIENFQKQLIKTNKVLSPEAMKTSKVGRREIGKAPEIAKEIKKAIDNPSKENIAKVAEETGVKEETLGEFLKKTKEEIQAAKKNPTEKTIEEKIKDAVNPFKNLPKQIRRGLTLTAIDTFFDEVLGFHLPYWALIGIGSLLGAPAGGAAATGIRHAVQYAFNAYHASELKKIRKNPLEFSKKIQELSKRYPKARLNKIIKMMKED